jgi:PAXIP1-associated-protein-1 C term PTIP binding protein
MRIICTHKKIWNFFQKSTSWIPAASEIQRMFETLDKSQVLDISWQCPGKRNPHADDGNVDSNELEEEEEYAVFFLCG